MARLPAGHGARQAAQAYGGVGGVLERSNPYLNASGMLFLQLRNIGRAVGLALHPRC